MKRNCWTLGAAAGAWLLAGGCCVEAQTLRFSNHREIKVPDYALARIGPFYSNIGFTQTAGYRYTCSRGAGTDFLIENRRGAIEKDGSDLPLISILNMRNYLIVTRRADIDVSIRLSYALYPLDTQRNVFDVDLPEESIVGELSIEFSPTPFVKGMAYDKMLYKTDYVDTRGIADEYGGEAFVYFRNTAGVNLDWLMSSNRNLAVSLSRMDLLPQGREFESQEQTFYRESACYEQRLNAFLAAGLGARFSQTDFRDRTRSDWSSREFYLHGNARLTSQTRASAEIGYTLASVANSPADDATADEDVATVVGSLVVETQMSEAWRQRLAAGRSVCNGFESAVETADSLSYRLEWKPAVGSFVFSSSYGVVEPDRDDVNGYSDWVNQIDVVWPLTSLVNLTLMTSYAARQNDATPVGDGAVPGGKQVDPEWSGDYGTWVTRLGTRFNLLKDVAFSAYAQHVERSGDSDSLSYQRDIVGAELAYSHEF
ncbi:MAG: hypothetical protein QME60_02470 [Verrucomicrobiota bacterium]|nr:hypothetical protein [Verrucomicrobiota bacterium]